MQYDCFLAETNLKLLLPLTVDNFAFRVTFFFVGTNRLLSSYVL